MFRQAIIAGISRELVFLEIKPKATCVGCTMQCNQRWIEFFDQQSNAIVVARGSNSSNDFLNDGGFFTDQHKPGQTVQLRLDSNEMIKASMRSYVQPLLIVVFFVYLGSLVFSRLSFNSDLGGLLAAAISLAVFIKYKSNRIISSPKVTFF